MSSWAVYDGMRVRRDALMAKPLCATRSLSWKRTRYIIYSLHQQFDLEGSFVPSLCCGPQHAQKTSTTKKPTVQHGRHHYIVSLQEYTLGSTYSSFRHVFFSVFCCISRESHSVSVTDKTHIAYVHPSCMPGTHRATQYIIYR